MFDGAYNNASGFTKSVSGFEDLSQNSTLCTSGGNSGVHCNLKVDELIILWDDGFGPEFFVISAVGASGLPTVTTKHGDSGGPVLVPRPDGTVGAAGMIQAGQGFALNCNGWTGTDTDCYPRVYFSSMRTILLDLRRLSGWSGAGLLTLNGVVYP